MKEKGLETEIRNIVFHLMRNSIRNEHKLVSQNVSTRNYRIDLTPLLSSVNDDDNLHLHFFFRVNQ